MPSAALPIASPPSIGAPMHSGRHIFALTKRSQPLDPRMDAFRPDLADVALADRLFAAHFAAPMTMVCSQPHTAICSAPKGDQTSELLSGEAFAVLDFAGDWAWGWSVHDHYVGYLAASDLAHEVAASRDPVTYNNATDAARSFIDMPYVWGGRGGAGIDCSGLVQRSLAIVGIAAPRDSDQQRACLGTEIDPANALPGDLIFFPGHVGFLTSGGMLLHATRHHGRVVEEPLADVVARMLAKHGAGIVAVKRVEIGQ